MTTLLLVYIALAVTAGLIITATVHKATVRELRKELRDKIGK